MFYNYLKKPKIGGFNCSTFSDNYKTNNSKDMITTAPETIDDFIDEDDITNAVDVYAFAFFLYQMFTTDITNIIGNNKHMKIFKYLNMVMRGHRPKKIDDIPDHYWELIKSCWYHSSNLRPTFHDIVNILKDDKFALEEFGMKTNLDELHEYQNRIENETRIKIEEKEEEEDLDLSKYSKINKIGENSLGEIFKVQSLETGQFYSAIVSNNIFNEEDLKNSNIYKEAKILSKLNHPCIPKLIGFSPIDFNNENKPLILIEFSTTNTLKQLFETERKIAHIDQWDFTKKFIHVYSLASCMSYLSSMDIIFKNLSPENIIVDDFLCPKLIDFTYSNIPQTLIQDNKENNEFIQASPKYFSPELIEYNKFSKSSDVYAFSLILYEIISCSKLFEGKTSFQIMNDILEGNRPQFTNEFDGKNNFYKNLINDCWSDKSSERKSFEEIVGVLISNFKTIDKNRKNDVNTYIDYIEQSQISYENDKQIIQIDDFIDNENKTFEKVDLKEINNEYIKKKKIKLNCNYINLNDYLKDKKIGKGNFGVVYKVINKKTNDPFAAKISKNELDDINEDELISHYREVLIISKLNHPSVLKFIGYSPVDFENKEKPVIITDLTQKGSLSNVINLERDSMALLEWDKTMKLINIYGIASSMSYLHRCNIIHRDLKPDNILLDENLYPKLADFGLSKEITEKNLNVPNTNYKFKGTPKYCSPEILSEHNYTKAGDVYAFGLIVYEIMTAEIPFNDAIPLYKFLCDIVNEKKRPTFTYPIQSCYEELIEKCWQHDYTKRPTFDEILEELRNNPEFVEDVDTDMYFDYIYSIDEIEKQYKNQEENTEYLKNILHKIELNTSIAEKIDENNNTKINENMSNVETIDENNNTKIDELKSDDSDKNRNENCKEENLEHIYQLMRQKIKEIQKILKMNLVAKADAATLYNFFF